MYRDRMYRADGAPPTGREGPPAPGRLGTARRRAERLQGLWPQVTTENLFELTDYAGYKKQFLNLFGFERADVNYDEDVATDVKFDCVEL
jgi:enoyl-[acyl-carrier protein] reductase/trans-2-enoyl-CoA reductase (NAD+)